MVTVASCVAYRDTWEPWVALFYEFWPDPKPAFTLLTDRGQIGAEWCEIVAEFACETSEPILLMQDDFFLTAPVRQDLIDHALRELELRGSGMVRLYPCPGADEDYGDPHYGIVRKGSRYRISCQASIWRPDYLHAIASQCSTPSDFETHGTEISESLPDEVLAFKGDSGPWPIEYFCSAINRAKWNPEALAFCEKLGISVDTSLREIAAQ